MRKARRHIERSWKTPFWGYAVVIASILCFLLFLCGIIVVVRVLLG